jgi:hypothetical protein
LETTLTAAVSLSTSLFSAGFTLYYWLVRARAERPNLHAYLVERAGHLGYMKGETRCINLALGVVVANYSSLPNALLGVKVAAVRKEGGLQEAAKVTFDEKTPMPFNLPPLQTVMLRVNAGVLFPMTDELERGGPAAYLNHHLGNPRRLKLELTGLGRRRHTIQLTWVTDG